jgi:hypothetical protein
MDVGLSDPVAHGCTVIAALLEEIGVIVVFSAFSGIPVTVNIMETGSWTLTCEVSTVSVVVLPAGVGITLAEENVHVK